MRLPQHIRSKDSNTDVLARTPAGRGAGDRNEGCVEVGEELEVGVSCAGFKETEEAVEAVESGGEGLDAVQPPRLPVIYGIARNEVGY